MSVRTYTGSATEASANDNPDATPDVYLFTTFGSTDSEEFECLFKAIAATGMTTPQEFAADIGACVVLSGKLHLNGPDFRYGLFSYQRLHDGSARSIDVARGREITPNLVQEPKLPAATPPVIEPQQDHPTIFRKLPTPDVSVPSLKPKQTVGWGD